MGLIMLFILIWLLYWGVTTMFPIPAQGQKVLMVVAVIVSILLVLAAFHLLPAGIKVPGMN